MVAARERKDWKSSRKTDDKYDLNQLMTEPWIPNQDKRQVSKMLWFGLESGDDEGGR